MLGNPDKALRDILYKDYRSQNKDLLSQVEVLFDLREEILKKLSNKGFTKNYYEDSIAERTKSRRQGSAEKVGEDLKILTPNQMLSRLPISLAQLNAGSNSEIFKNEIRQILYSLYRSKKLIKKNL